MHVGDDGLVTKQMIAVFVLFGAEFIPVVVILGAVGVLPLLVSGLVVGGIVALFAGWIFARWRRLRSDENDALERDPVETLKQRYAAGELSDDEFERKLERLMDTPGEYSGESTRTDDEIGSGEIGSTRNKGGSSERIRESN